MADPLHIDGLDELIGKIDTLEKMRAVAGGLLLGGGHMKTAMQVYPDAKHLTRASVYGQPFQSDRQRKFFFYALAKGIIQVPYRRGGSPGSRNLKQQWTVAATNNGFTVEIGNATPYGPLVQAQGLQSRYAQAVGWQTDQQVLDREAPAVVGFVKDAIDQAVND